MTASRALHRKEGALVAIIMRLDRVMADRKMSLNELSERVGVANVNLSKMKTGKISAIRFSTLDAICHVLDCQPGDILEFSRDDFGEDFGREG
jgi:putative transcriptional regulator